MYSSGLPVLYPIAALSFALSYWAEKAELLKMCRPPQHHHDGLARQSGNFQTVLSLTGHLALGHLARLFRYPAKLKQQNLAVTLRLIGSVIQPHIQAGWLHMQMMSMQS